MMSQIASGERIHKYFTGEIVIWKLHPSHFGGLWEVDIKKMKNQLKGNTGEHILTYEDFQVLIAQIELKTPCGYVL